MGGQNPDERVHQVTERPTLTNLQICRALAALVVVFGHSLHDADTISVRANVEALQPQVNWGFGVDVFFVISGFIMVHVARDDFATPMASWRFLRRRLVRIVPLYWTLTSVFIVASFLAPGLLNIPIGGLSHIVNSYLFIPDWRPDMSAMRPVLALGWTLNYEMFFYALFAASMLLPFSRAIPLLTAIFVAAVSARSIFHIEQSQLNFWMDPRILEFLFGVYLAIAYRAGWRLAPVPALALAAVGLAALTTGLVPALGIETDIQALRFGVPAVMLVAATTLGPRLPDSPLTRFGVRLGDVSYALYLVHPFVIRPLRELWLKLDGGSWPLEAYSAICVLGAVCAAFALHEFYERPVLRALQQRVVRSASGGARVGESALQRPAG